MVRAGVDVAAVLARDDKRVGGTGSCEARTFGVEVIPREAPAGIGLEFPLAVLLAPFVAGLCCNLTFLAGFGRAAARAQAQFFLPSSWMRAAR